MAGQGNENNELNLLQREIEDLDLTIDNPLVRELFVKEVRHWTYSYLRRRRERVNDEYGDERTKIPDVISISGASYTPLQLFQHVQSNSSVRTAVLERMQQYVAEKGIYKEMKNNIMGLGPDTHLNSIMGCHCGNHPKITLKEAMEGIITLDSDNFFLRERLCEAVMSLYNTK
jgi:hypothetical protein